MDIINPQSAPSELAAQANHHHQSAQDKATEAVRHAVEAGRALTDAKAALGHGEWSTWLADNFKGSARHARRYMQLHQRMLELPESKRTHVANLPSLRQALEAITPDDKKGSPVRESLLSRPANDRHFTFTAWPDLAFAWALLLDEAGMTLPEIVDNLAIDADLVSKLLNPVSPVRFAQEGDALLFALYSNAYSGFIANARCRAYRCAASNSAREGYAELEPTLGAMAKRAHREWLRHNAARSSFVQEIVDSGLLDAEGLVPAVIVLAVSDFRAATGLEAPTLPYVANIRDAAARHWQELKAA
jgi:hypothetical protein